MNTGPMQSSTGAEVLQRAGAILETAQRPAKPFNVAFRNRIGQSPHDYILQRRVERAQGLMLASDKTLAEIADECGLADQSHFTRLFRRFVGESPAAWRRARVTPRE